MGAYRSYDHIDHVSNPFEMITGAITLPRRLKKVGLDEDIYTVPQETKDTPNRSLAKRALKDDVWT